MALLPSKPGDESTRALAPPMPELPTTLFKYQPFDSQYLLNLRSKVIYFGSPSNFNDPYDFATPLTVRRPTKEELAATAKQFLTLDRMPAKVKDYYRALSPSDGDKFLIERAASGLESIRTRFLNEVGVTCLSERKDNLLMWSHYADKGSGMCLEFRTGHIPFENIRPITYAEEIPLLGIENVLCSEPELSLRSLFCTKSSDWAYEREWRAFNRTVDAVTYPVDILKAVYCGPEMKNEAIELIRLILDEQYQSVELWKGHRSNSDFEVLYQRVAT